MGTFADEVRKSVEVYVTKAVIFVNAILLLCHIVFAFYFESHDAEIVYYYNLISIIIYIAAFDMLRRQKAVVYIITVYVEISLFMIVAVLCMGWDMGFQQYCIGFIIVAFFVDFYTTKERRINRVTLIIVALEVLVYVIMRIMTYSGVQVYEIEKDIFAEVIFIVNTLASYVIMIAFCCIYSTTVFRLEQTLLDVASVDPMTGLHNRRSMHDLMTSVMDEYKKHPKPLCVGMLDVDHFKNINDTYGHDVGDIVLKKLAELLIAKYEENSNFYVCRWGGEEFLVLYTGCSEQKEVVCREFEEFRKKVENAIVLNGDDKIDFTVTIGLAFFDNEMSVTELLKLADTNLYKGKESGRNKVVW